MWVTPKLIDYITRTYNVIVRDGNIDSIPTTSTCPECGADFDTRVDAMADPNGAHLVVELPNDKFAVIVGCEGYWVVNPNLVGIDAPNWSDGSALGDELPQVGSDLTAHEVQNDSVLRELHNPTT